MKKVLIVLMTIFISYLNSYSQDTLTASGIISNNSCNVNGNWKINLSVIGGILPYTFLWSNGQTTEDIDSLLIGIYYVTITDYIGLNLIDTFNIIQPPILQVQLEPHTETCFGVCNGFIIPNIQGGQLPYSYMWSNLDEQLIADSLCPGSYSLTVTDFNNCSATTNSVINGFDPLQILFVNIEPSINGQANGSASISVLGGSFFYTYQWIPNVSISTFATGLFSGNYTVIVRDGNDTNCFITTNFIIFDTITSIDQFNFVENKIIVSPNPVKNTVQIQIPSFNESNLYIELINNLGELIYSENVEKQNDENYNWSFQINKTNIKSGLYFLKFKLNGTIYLKKIMVE